MLNKDTIKNLIEERARLLNRVQIIDNYLIDIIINDCDTNYLKPQIIDENKVVPSKDVNDSKIEVKKGKVALLFDKLVKTYGSQKDVSRMSNLSVASVSLYCRSTEDKLSLKPKTIEALKASKLSDYEKEELSSIINNMGDSKNVVEKIRKSKGLSQSQFATAIGIGDNTVWKIETSKSGVKVSGKVFNAFLKAEILSKEEREQICSFIHCVNSLDEQELTEFGKELEKIRIEVGLTRDEFADILDLSHRSDYTKLLWKKLSYSDIGRLQNSSLDEKYKERLEKFYPTSKQNKVVVAEKGSTISKEDLDKEIETWVRKWYGVVSEKTHESFRNYIKNHKLYEINDLDDNEIKGAKDQLKKLVEQGEGYSIPETYFNAISKIFKANGYNNDMTDFWKRYYRLSLLNYNKRTALFKKGMIAYRRKPNSYETRYTQRDIALRINSYPAKISGIELGDKVNVDLAFKMFENIDFSHSDEDHIAYWICSAKNQDEKTYYELMKRIMKKHPISEE